MMRWLMAVGMALGATLGAQDDLEGFWREAYPRIRRELARRYPKHEWR